jgi:hypothetical protein
MKGVVPVLTLVLAVGFTAPIPQNQPACEKAGMNWDATASAPKVKCNPAFADASLDDLRRSGRA